MGRHRCRVCRHPQRDVIDAALVLGAPGKRKIALQFGIHEEQLRRHARHLSGMFAPASVAPAAVAPSPEAGAVTPTASHRSRRAVLRVTYELEFLD